MAEFPALPLFTDAYIADTGDLSTEEHGAYILMLMLAWRRPDCALPNDLKWLKRALNGYAADMHGNRFNRIVPKLLTQFFLEIDGKFYQKRLGKERDFLRKRSGTQRDIANKRWSQNKENNNLENANAIPAGNAPTPTPTPTPIERSKITTPLPPSLLENRFEEFWKYFPKQRAGGKQKAFDAYRQAIQRSPEQEIIAGCISYASSDEVSRGFAKGAAAWLNDDRWTCDYSPKPKGTRYEKPTADDQIRAALTRLNTPLIADESN